MTTIDSYHTTMVAPEQSPHASTEQRVSASAPSGDLPVTPEEEEAWLNMLRDLAGMTA